MAADTLEFFDIAANLTDGVFHGVSHKGARLHDDDFDQVVARFQAAGVRHVLVSGTSLDVADKAIGLCRQHPAGTFYATVGVHPAHSLEFDRSGDPAGHLERLRRLITENRDVVRAVGEVGLDYAELEECPKDVQAAYFEAQFALAEESGLPMFLHSRDCGLDFVEIVERHRHRFSTGVVHSFTGGDEELRRLLALGLSIGVTGASLRTAEQVERLKSVPADRLMLETDAPWCDIRKGNFGFPDVKTHFETRPKNKFQMGKCVERRNEPCHVVQVFEVLTAHHPDGQRDPQAFASQLFRNAEAMFLRPEASDSHTESSTPP